MWVETAIQYHQKNLEQKKIVYVAAKGYHIFSSADGIDRRQEFSK